MPKAIGKRNYSVDQIKEASCENILISVLKMKSCFMR